MFTPYGELEEDKIPQLQLMADTPAAPAPTPDGGVWERAAALMQRREAGRQRAPQRQMPAIGAPPEHNNTSALWAMALDLLGSKGRNIGGIAQADIAAKNNELKQWRAQNSPDAMLEREARLQQLNAGDRAVEDKDFQRQMNVAEMLGKEGDRSDARNFRDKSFGREGEWHENDVATKQQFHADDLTHQQRAEQLQRDQMAQQDAQSRRQLGLGYANLNQSGRQFDASQAGQAERLRLELEQKQAERAAAAAKDQATRSQHDAERNQELSHQFSEETEKQRQLLGPINTATEIAQKYKGKSDVPGIGRLDGGSANPGIITSALRGIGDVVTGKSLNREYQDDAHRMRAALQNAQTYDISALSGSNFSQAEAAQAALRAGGGNMSETDALRAISTMEDAIKKDFQARSKGREGIAREQLAPYGRSGWIGQDGANTYQGINGLTRVSK